jgi:vitamin B12 transporter
MPPECPRKSGWMHAARAALLALAGGTAPLAGQQEPPDTFRLRELVVTATRLPLPRAAVPAAVSVVSGDELRARGVQYVADALRELPGLAVVRSGATGGIASLFARGGESDYVQVLIDGVQVNDPGGSFDLSHLTTDDVERIEVVRGPVSVLYGSDAVTGAVHIITRRGQGAARLLASVGGSRSSRTGQQASGGYGSWAASAALAGGSANTGYALSASRHTTDGAYAFNNHYGNTTLGGQFRLSHARTAATLNARWSDGVFHYPTNGAGVLVDRNQFRSSRASSLGLEARRTLAPWLNARLALTQSRGHYASDDRPDNAADTLGSFASLADDRVSRRTADVSLDLRPLSALVLTVGGEAERQTAKSRFESESSFGPFADASDNQRSNRAGYAQLIVRARPLTVTLGGRLDDNDRFGTFRTYRAGINAQLGGLLLRLAAGTAFKEPTFFENYAAGFARGNRALQPERSRSAELGMEAALLDGRITLGATAYTQRFRNLIQYTFAPPTPDASNYFNIGAAQAAGVETAARFSTGSGFSAAATWDLVETEVLDEGFGADRQFLEGRPLLRRPRHHAVVRAGWTAARWTGSVVATRVGRRADLDFSDASDFAGRRMVLPGYTTVDLAGEYALRPRTPDLRLILRLENVFDERYTEISNFPALRRSVFAGVRTALGF